jgi:hypothetical protein
VLRWAPAYVLLACAPATALAFECKYSDRYDWVTLHWSARAIQYGVRRGAAAEVSALEVAFAAWAAPACSDLEFEFVGVVDESDPVNQIVFVTENWASPEGDRDPRPPEAVAVTLTRYNLSDGEIRAAIIDVNEEAFEFADVSESCSEGGNTYDLIAVLTHEVGHFIGLDHTKFFNGSSTDPTMAPRVGACELDKRTLEADDLEALCLIYPSGQPARSCEALPPLGPETDYVSNRPFGCTSATPTAGDGGLLALVLLLCRILATKPGPGDNRDQR